MNILLTGGRAAATLDLARLLKRAGHRVVMAEHIWWHLSRPSLAIAKDHRLPWPTRDLDGFAEALVEIIQSEGIDLFIPTCEELFHVARIRDRLPKECRVLVTGIQQLDRVHNKWLFVQQARTHGLDVPVTEEVKDTESLRKRASLALSRGERIVLKPAYSRFSALTVVEPTMSDIENLSADGAWVVQRFIPGRRICTWAVAHGGRMAAYTAYETLYTLGQGASVNFEHLEHPAAEEWTSRFLAGESFTGQIGLDLIEASDGRVYGIEANPRITSGMHLFSHLPKLAEALWNPKMDVLKPVGGPPAMLGVSMVLHLLGQVRTWEAFRAWWSVFSRSREVVYSIRDPLPMFWRYLWLGGLLLRARSVGLPPQQAISIDMEWNGE
jgi:glutathione synthase/RimK-type ligase-like ATP-grasp enzyme